MAKPLSPAAQAVLDAFLEAPFSARPEVAAALRALADQVLPASSSLDRATWSPFAGQIRSEVLAIADELEGWADG
jgi:uncharacterized caspase-like protein